MFAIAVNALYTSIRRRGTTRQLAGAILTCVIAALLLLPALVWYNVRFSSEQAIITGAEVEVALVYVALFGWVLPLSVSTAYCLFALPRTSTTSMYMPRHKRSTRLNAATRFHPPRHQPGVMAPYVFSEEVPWGWLEYRNGRLQGQRLALKRAIVTIGRGEENDIWLDDDMASRNHAELAWHEGKIYITDCDSLNGILLNGRRIHTTDLVESDDSLEIGSHRFFFVQAEQALAQAEQDDPLAHHVWHSTADLQGNSEKIPMTDPLNGEAAPSQSPASPGDGGTPYEVAGIEAQDTVELQPVVATPQPVVAQGMFVLRAGETDSQRFLLARPVMTMGRDSECDIVINDVSISRRHAQVLQQLNGLYIQDLSSRNGTKVNDERLFAPRRLQFGDRVSLGNVQMEYVEYIPGKPVEANEPTQSLEPIQDDRATPIPPPLEVPQLPFVRMPGTPGLLRLPGRPKPP